MKNKKCWIALNQNGRVLLHTLSSSKAGVITDFVRRHRRHYTPKQLRDAGISIVRCDLHFLSNVTVDLPDTSALDYASKTNNPDVSG